MDVAALRRQIEADVAAGDVPCHGGRHRRVGQHRRGRSAAARSRASAGSTASGSTSTAPTAASRRRCPDAPDDLRGLELADSVAVDPHKWLYAPLEAGCALVRDAGSAARRVRLPPALLPLRGARDQLRRLRPAELARLPRAEGLARAETGGRRRLPADDRRRHPAVAGDGGGGPARTPELRARDAGV